MKIIYCTLLENAEIFNVHSFEYPFPADRQFNCWHFYLEYLKSSQGTRCYYPRWSQPVGSNKYSEINASYTKRLLCNGDDCKPFCFPPRYRRFYRAHYKSPLASTLSRVTRIIFVTNRYLPRYKFPIRKVAGIIGETGSRGDGRSRENEGKRGKKRGKREKRETQREYSTIARVAR